MKKFLFILLLFPLFLKAQPENADRISLKIGLDTIANTFAKKGYKIIDKDSKSYILQDSKWKDAVHIILFEQNNICYIRFLTYNRPITHADARMWPGDRDVFERAHKVISSLKRKLTYRTLK